MRISIFLLLSCILVAGFAQAEEREIVCTTSIFSLQLDKPLESDDRLCYLNEKGLWQKHANVRYIRKKLKLEVIGLKDGRYTMAILDEFLVARPPHVFQPKKTFRVFKDTQVPDISFTYDVKKPGLIKTKADAEIFVKWKASDANLSKQPITLYARNKGEDWTIIARHLENKGAHKIKVPPFKQYTIFQFKLSIEDVVGHSADAYSTSYIIYQ